MRMLSEKELQDARDSLETLIGATTVADGITPAKENAWKSLIEELTLLSIQDARRMGDDGILVPKIGYNLRPDQMVHTRFLAIILELSAWMGMQWESHTDQPKNTFLAMVNQAYDAGRK